MTEPRKCQYENCGIVFVPKSESAKFCPKHQLKNRSKFHFCLTCGKIIWNDPKNKHSRLRFCSEDCLLRYKITGVTFKETEIKNKETEVKKVDV